MICQCFKNEPFLQVVFVENPTGTFAVVIHLAKVLSKKLTNQ